jgi:hypothetical protein
MYIYIYPVKVLKETIRRQGGKTNPVKVGGS